MVMAYIAGILGGASLYRRFFRGFREKLFQLKEYGPASWQVLSCSFFFTAR
jgi:hypothetical protein